MRKNPGENCISEGWKSKGASYTRLLHRAVVFYVNPVFEWLISLSRSPTGPVSGGLAGYPVMLAVLVIHSCSEHARCMIKVGL